MATVSDDPFSDCSIASLLPRTLGGSISAGASLSDSDDQAFIDSIFKATVGRNFTQLLENAKTINNSNCSIISNKIHEKENNILGKRTLDGQVEAQHKRVRQRRPGLPSSVRGGDIFNVSSNTIAVKASQIGTAEFSKRRLSSTESRFADNQAVPVVDYSCLENIKDPTEYLSTYRMLENAEKEVKKLCGNTSLNLSQHQVQGNRLRRRGLSELAGKKYVFKFPGTDSTVEASQKESSSLSNAVDITELITSSSSKKIIQTENLLTVEPKIKLGGASKTSDLNVEEDELDRLLSKCKELDNDELGIGNLVRDTLQINPIHVEKLNVFSISALTKSTYESTEPRPLTSFKEGHKPVGFSDLKDCLTVINQQGDPLSLLSHDGEKWSDGSKELGSSSMDCCDVGTQMLSYNKSGIQDELEKLKCDFKGHRVDDIPKSEQDNLQAKLLDAKEMTNLVDNLSIFEKSVPLIDIQGRLDKITSLNSHILQRNAQSENLQFSDNDFESFSSSKYREVSQVDTVHHDGSFLDTQTTRDQVLSHEKRLSFEDAIHSPVIQNLDDNKVVCHEKTSDSNAFQSSFPEKETFQTSDVFSFAKELASDFDFVDVIVDAPEQQLHTHSPELQLHPEVRKDQDRSEIPTVMDEQIDDRSNIVSAKNESQRHSGGSGESRPRKLKRKKQIMNRKSLSGAGTIWEMGVRRSTRIRVKPLQFWCGERLLYGRVHDSLATVIGVKTVGTPEAGKQAVMKVKSFVSEQYADLVAQAALH